jgi:anaerobic glycerol-3-phosphate dehydrogenase
LDGAVTGFETFSSAIGNTNTTYYAIALQGGAEFEVGLGTVAAGTLARTTIISSSNSDSAVDFSAGTKDVFCTLPASKAVYKDASDTIVGVPSNGFVIAMSIAL